MFDFPWSNFHELNLDWILSVVKEAKEIFVKGEGDIQHAVETADQALETAEQAAAGVIADGAVTIPKLNSEVYSLFAYCVSGSVAPNFIPAGSLVILRKSTIYNVSDGIYTATRNIPQAAIITAADLDQSATLYREGGLNYLLHNEEKLSGTIDLIKAGLVILVTGDEASAAIPADGLAYVTNNTHGLTEGFYFNSSGATFPPTGGTADSDSFTAVNNILNALQSSVATLGSDDIANDSTVTGASVTDALDAVKNTLDQLVKPNLLDNWYFVNPVNQRGQASYSNAGYTIDRWKLTSGSVAVVSGGITLNGTLVQILEASIGQTVTASALLSDGSMITPTYDDATKTFTLTATGQTIVAVKLELGTIQTLAHQENGVWVVNEVTNYQDELVKCIGSHADTSDTYANYDYAKATITKKLIKSRYTKSAGNLPVANPATISVTEAGIYAVILNAQCQASGGDLSIVFYCGSSGFELFDKMDYAWKKTQTIDFFELPATTATVQVATTPTDLEAVGVTLIRIV